MKYKISIFLIITIVICISINFVINANYYIDKETSNNTSIEISVLSIDSLEESSILQIIEQLSNDDIDSFETLDTESIEEELLIDENSYDNNDKICVDIYNEYNNVIDIVYIKLYNKFAQGFNTSDAYLFFDDVFEIYKNISQNEGIPISAMLAQAYTEGGAGKTGIYTKSNNLFGITAGSWKGYVYSRETGLCYDSVKSAMSNGCYDLFRVYTNIEESIYDYIKLITTSQNYKKGLWKNSEEYLKNLVNYNYGEFCMLDVWIELIHNFDFSQYEKVYKDG